MLQTKSLWFSRADCLGDPLEGSVPRIRYEAELVDRGGDDNQISDWRRAMLTKTHISCWHANDDESFAMWRLYAKSDEAIAIRTDYAKINKILSPTIFGGLVRYIDYDRDDLPSLNILQPLIHKRRSFEHEREFRLFAWELGAGPEAEEIRGRASATGLAWPLEPNAYIDAVYVSPWAPKWFHSVIQQSARDGGLTCPVLQSGLNTAALY